MTEHEHRCCGSKEHTRKWLQQVFFQIDVGDGNWRQAKPGICFLPGVVEVNALAQGTLRRFTQWSWIEHPTFQSRGGRFKTELSPPQ